MEYPPTPDTAREHAESIVRQVQQLDGILLDYSPESLAFVDSLVERFRNTGHDIQNYIPTLFDLGCYLGEVFIKNVGGNWVNSGEIPVFRDATNMPILLKISEKNIGNPIGKIIKRFQNGSEDNLVYFYQVFSKRN